MKKLFKIIIFGVIAAAVVTGCSKGYESKKTVDDVIITITADRYPLVKGDNTLTMKLSDASGKPVTDAMLVVRYYMPPMTGMAPMEFNVQPVSKGNAYAFTANVPMEGGWKVEVNATRPNKAAATVTFNLDAR